VLSSARAATKAQQQLSAKVKKALRYPAIVLTLAVLVVLAMVTLVLPEFAAIYKTFNTPLPVLTQMVMGMAAFMQSYALALFTLLLAPLAVAWALRQNPRWQCILLHTPVMGALAKGQKLGHVFTVLSLTQAGIPFYRAWRAQRRPLKVATGGDTPQRSGGH
jgi:protein transport protein HofC